MSSGIMASASETPRDDLNDDIATKKNNFSDADKSLQQHGILSSKEEEKLINLDEEEAAKDSSQKYKLESQNNESNPCSPTNVIINFKSNESTSTASVAKSSHPELINNYNQSTPCKSKMDDKLPSKQFNEFDCTESRKPSASSAEINTILDNFNSILDNVELNYEIQDLQLEDAESRDFIVKSMENLSNALVNNEMSNSDPNDLLVIVETENDPDSSEDICSDSDNNASETEVKSSKGEQSDSNSSKCLSSVKSNNNHSQQLTNDSCGESESDIPELLSYEVDLEEGYESDRPMMGRASMKKLRPIKMLPMPSNLNAGDGSKPSCSTAAHCSSTSCNEVNNSSTSMSKLPVNSNEISNEKYTFHSPAGAQSSQITNMMVVTSLVNNILSSPEPSTSSSIIQSIETTPSCTMVNGRTTNNENLMQIESCALAGMSTSGTGSPSSNETIVNNVNISDERNSSSTTTAVSNAGHQLNNHNNNTSSTVRVVEPSTSSSSFCSAGSGTTNVMGNNLSSNEILGSSISTTSTTAPTPTTVTRTTVVRHANRTITIPPGDETSSVSDRNNNNDADDESSSLNGKWPHRLSSVLALLGCTLGLNNICRFSLLSVQYGANFTIQFLILSIIIGMPLLTFHMSIGQYLNAGIIDMWKISPIFQGIGIGLVISQAMIGIYTAVGVSWMFIYFRDSFITRFDQYRWGKCFHDYRGCDPFSNNTSSLAETVPDYFNGVVLQRSTPDYPSSTYFPTSLKFTVAFNLAVVWMLIFVSLSKGLKSYGKVIHGFILIPIVAVLILASKMVGIVPTDDTGSLFGQTEWTNFFFNSQTWVLAAREAFFTWGIFGACVMQITSHNRYEHSLKSDASIVILITTFVLFLSAFIGNACYSILLSQDYIYTTSSFESIKTYQFLIKKPPDFPPNMQILPSYMNQHTSFLMGVRITKPEEGFNHHTNSHNAMMGPNSMSGYQALRVATELYPATMAVLGSTALSPFWTVLFYFTFILFGVAQLIAIWHCVIQGVIAINGKILKSWETTITFFVCALGFGLGLPLCTELGIFIIYFLDYCIGSGWWIMVLYLLELVAVFVVRGAPFAGENIVTVFMTGNGKLAKYVAPLMSFIWNVILPVVMLILSIASFKSGNVRELYDWSFSTDGYVFWPSWTRELGSFIQLIPILTVPFVAIVQSCRYLTNGPSDLFDRLQQLYRPHSRGLLGRTFSNSLGRSNENGNNGDVRSAEDPPPKYTPPPSYSTATSARIAKFLRESLRRSLRRISSNPGFSSADPLPPPPNYASVILEINSEQRSSDCCPPPSSTVMNTTSSTIAGNASSSSASSRMTTTNDNLLPILLPIISSLSSSSSQAGTIEHSPASTSTNNNSNNSNNKYLPSSEVTHEKIDFTNEKVNTIEDKNINVNTKATESHNHNEFDRSSLRRIASDITPSDVARILRATFQKDTLSGKNVGNINNNDVGNSDNLVLDSQIELGGSSKNNNPNNVHSSNPCNDFSLDRHTSIDSDQFYSCNNSSNNSTFTFAHARTSSYPRTNHFYNNFVDFSRCSRRSNDSQIALILDPSRRESLASDILPNDNFLSLTSSYGLTTQNGIVNPTFQLNNNESIEPTTSTTTTTTNAIITPNISSSNVHLGHLSNNGNNSSSNNNSSKTINIKDSNA